MTTVLSLIAGVREAANALRTAEATIDEIADACGFVREIEIMLAEWRRSQEGRLRDATDPIHDDQPYRPDTPDRAPTATGSRYELVPSHTTDRTYNTPRILHDLQTALGEVAGIEPSIGRLLSTLEERRVVDIRWRWTELKAYARVLGVTLSVGRETLDTPDMESPHIGEVKRVTGYKRQPIVDADARP